MLPVSGDKLFFGGVRVQSLGPFVLEREHASHSVLPHTWPPTKELAASLTHGCITPNEIDSGTEGASVAATRTTPYVNKRCTPQPREPTDEWVGKRRRRWSPPITQNLYTTDVSRVLILRGRRRQNPNMATAERLRVEMRLKTLKSFTVSDKRQNKNL